MNSKSIYTPFTYLIGWSKLNKWYYGSRYAKDCNPAELWVSYYTSSKVVDEYRELHGEPDVIQIRKTFNSADHARYWENTVLKRLAVIKETKWLNKTDNLAIAPMPGKDNPMYGNGHLISEDGRRRCVAGQRKWREGVKESGEWNKVFGKCSEVNRNVVEIDGIVYESMKEASTRLGVSMYFIRKWLAEGKATLVKPNRKTEKKIK